MTVPARDAAIRQAALSDLVAGADIADMLGVTDQAVCNWQRRHPDYPEPVLRVARGNMPLWSRLAVLTWAANTGRLPNRIGLVIKAKGSNK